MQRPILAREQLARDLEGGVACSDHVYKSASRAYQLCQLYVCVCIDARRVIISLYIYIYTKSEIIALDTWKLVV